MSALVETFESGYSNGTLLSSQSWTTNAGTQQAQSSTTLPHAGSFGVVGTTNGTNSLVKKAMSLSDMEIQEVYVRAAQTNKTGGISFQNASASWLLNFYMLNSGDIGIYIDTGGGAAYVTALAGYSANTWYRFQVQYRALDGKYRARVDSGSWTAWGNPGSGATGAPGYISIDTNDTSGGTFYWDDFAVGSAGANYTQTCTAAVTYADTLIRFATRALTESKTYTDTISRILSLVRTLTESATYTASLIKTAGRALLEAVTYLDTFVEGKIVHAGPNSGGTFADGGGALAVWSNPSNASASDSVYATAASVGSPTPYGSTTGIDDHSIQLIKGGTASGTDHSTAAEWPASDAYSSYGSATDLWGLTLTPSDINASTFGVAINVASSKFDNQSSNSLDATNFGFAIPSTATIKGVVVEIKKHGDAIGAGSSTAYIDHIRITVYYLASGNQWAQTLTDAVTSADVLIKTTTKALTDSVTYVDSVVRSTARMLVEASTSVDTVLKSTGRAMADAFTSSDTFSFFRTKAATLTDSVTYLDTIARSAVRAFVEGVTNMDTFSGFKATVATLADSFNSTDTLARSITKALNDVVTYADSLGRSLFRLFVEASTMIDTVSGARVLPAMLTDTITYADTVARTTTRALVESVTYTSSLLRSLVRALTDAVTSADTLAANRLRTLVLPDAITTLDALIRSMTRGFAEAVASTDIFGSTKIYFRTFSDGITTSATLLKLSLRQLVDSIASTDVMTRVWTAGRVMTEMVAYTAKWSFLKNGSDILWYNVAKAADSVLSNAAKHVASLSTVLKSASAWRNEDKS